MYRHCVKDRAPESFRRLFLATAGVASLLLAGCPAAKPANRPAPTVQVAPVNTESHVPSTVDAGNVAPATLQIIAIDDRSHVLSRVVHNDVPPDIELETEDVPVGVDQNGQANTRDNTYAVAHARAGESAKQTRARLLQWLTHFNLPAGEHFAAQDVYAPLPDASRLVRSGARSYVLEDPPVITSADIAHVEAIAAEAPVPMCEVRVSLTDGGAKRFLDATRRLVQRRMAILVDGVVKSAPVVMSPIPGGHLIITVGNSMPDACPEAHKIAATLRRGAHGPRGR